MCFSFVLICTTVFATLVPGIICTSALRNHMALVQRVLESNADVDEKTWNKVKNKQPT